MRELCIAVIVYNRRVNAQKIADPSMRLPAHMRSRFKPPQVPRYTCATCGRECTLPFKPTPGKPITCTDCWKREHSPTGRREPIHQLAMTRPEDRMFKAGLSWRWKPRA